MSLNSRVCFLGCFFRELYFHKVEKLHARFLVPGLWPVTATDVHGVATLRRTREKDLTTFSLDFFHGSYIMVAYLIIDSAEGESRHLNVFDDFVYAYLIVIIEMVFVTEHLHVDVLVEVWYALLVCLQGMTKLLKVLLWH